MYIAVGLLLSCGACVVRALPVGGTTTTGTGKISQSADVLTVQQSSARLAIDWQSFNIGSGESVIFKQPSAQSIALNRVLGQDPSVILGSLSANGQVFVLNPNGVLFGHGAQVDVGGLLASSLQLSVADFLAGHYTLSGSDSSGSVINQGTLHARDGGYIALVGPQVINEGVITAHLGTAALGAGQQVTLTMDAGRLLSFSVDRAAADALVSNKQLIEADGGAVIMSAQAKDALLSTVVNNQGLIEARSVSVKDGVIQLDGGTNGVVASSGTLDASGISAGEHGGRIEVTGNKIGLFDGALVNASGAAGGGTVLIGGDTQGRNPAIRNAQAAYVAPTAKIKADALDSGNGGKVVVWSDEMTRFAGSISARGGISGGNGGNVETSGKAYLEAAGTVDASAPTGRAGEWLLDPYDVTLSTSASANGSFAAGVFTPSGNSAVASITTIQTSLNGGTSVTINTTGAGTQAGDITVANSIAKTAGGTATLTLNATNQINFSAGANLTSTTGALNVTLNAGAGGINNLQNVNTNGGALKFNSSGAATQAAGSVISGTGTLLQQGSGVLTLSGANTYTGATTVSAGTLVAASATALGTTAGGVSVTNGATLSINNVAIGAETVTLNGTGIGGNGALTGTGTASLAGNVVLGSASSIGTPAASDTLTLSGVISGANGLTKLGAGTAILSGNDTYTGATAIAAGTLQLGAANRIANGSAVTVAAGATFNLNSFAETIGSIAGAGDINLGSATLTAGGDNTSTSFSGVISGSGGLIKAGTGTTTLSGANTYTGATTISTGTLRLQGGSAIADASAVTLANTAGVFLDLAGADETIGSLAGGGTTGGNVTLGTGTLTAGANNTSTTYSGVISGTGGLIKAGTGTLTLAGTNTYDGLTSVNGGILSATNASALGTTASGTTVNSGSTLSVSTNILAEALTLNGGTLTKDNAATTRTWSGGITLNLPSTVSSPAGTLILSGTIDGTGDLTKTGTGALTLSGNNLYTGQTNINAGTIQVAGGNGIGDASAVSVAAGATLNLGGTNESVGSLAGAGSVVLGVGTLTAGGNDGSTTYSGVLSGTGGLTKIGAGTLIFSGSNTYTGKTSINAGVLQLGAANRIADTSAVTIAAGASFNLNGFAETVGSIAGGGNISLGAATLTAGGDNTSTNFAGAIDGTGGLIKAGSGALTLSGTNTYTGNTTINAGTLRLSGGSAIADTSAVSLANVAGVTLDVNGTSETIGSLAGGGTTGGNVVLGAGTLTAGNNNTSTTYSGVVSGTGGLTKAGTGIMTLSGANLYTGATSVSAGTLQLGAASRIADTSAVNIAGGATFNLNGFAETVGSIAGAGNITLGAATLTAGGDNTSTNFAGAIAGTGGLVKAGSGVLTLSGANTYTGSTTVNAGTLRLSGGSAIADTSAVSLANVAGVTLDVNDSTETIGSLAGGGATGGNVVLGAGTLTAGNNNTSTTYSGVVSGTGGLTKVGTGIMTLSGANLYTGVTSVSAGTLQLGAANRIADTSAVTVASGATFNLNNFAETVGSIAGSGNLALGTASLAAGIDNTSTTYSGIISGTGGIAKQGTGVLTLSGTNTYTGATTVSAGTLVAANATALGTTAGGVTVTNGATLSINNVAIGAETVTLNGTGDGGNGALTGTGTASLAGNLVLASASSIGTPAAGDTLTLSGVISGANGFTKLGAGTAILSGNDTYTGVTAIAAGTLQLGAANRIANGSAVTVAAGATFNLNSFAETIGSIAGAGNINLGSAILTAGGDNTATTFSGTISGTGGLTKVGTGTTTLSGVNTYTGATTISTGTLRLQGGSAIADVSAVTLANTAGVFLDLGGADETIGSLAGGGTTGGNVTLGTGTLTAGANTTSTTYSGVISGTGGLAKAGTGVLTLSGSNTYTGPTNIGAGTLLLGAANRIADTSAVTIAAGATFNLNGFAETVGSIAGAGNITVGAATLTAGGDNTSTSFAGAISGTGGFTKTGAGMTTLSGTNTYTGATTISAGILRLQGSSAIADTSAVTLANAANTSLDLNDSSETIGSLAGGGATGGNVTLGTGTLTAGGNNTSTTYSGVISGTGGLTKAGTGTLTLAAANTYGGLTSINGGVLSATNASALGTTASGTTVNSGSTLSISTDILGESLTLNGGTLTKDNAATTRTWSGGVTLALSSTVSPPAGTLILSGTLDGIGDLTKTGAGTLTLSGNNLYTGQTNINAGTTQVAGGNGIGDASAVSVAASATLNLGGTNESVGSLAGAGNVVLGAGTLTAGGNNGSTTYSGVLSGTGGISKAGTGVLTLSGSNTYTGITSIGAGTLQLGAANRIADTSAIAVTSGATFSLNNFAETVGSIAGAGNITMGSATLTTGGDNTATTFSGTISGTGGLTKVGTGTTTLSGVDTYTGATTISAGTLRLQGGSAIADVSAVTLANTAGASLDLNGADETIGSLAGGGATGGNVTLTGGTLTAGGNNTSTTYSGALSGTGGLDKAGTGTLILAGVNTYSGDTIVGGGTLRVAGGNGIGDSSSVTVSAGAILSLNGTNETIGSLAGPGAVSLGAGTLTTGSNNTSTLYSGVISGTGGLIKSGIGALTLSGSNTYSGATTISGGTLVASNSAALGSTVTGTSVASGATLQVDNVTLNSETITLNGIGAGGAGALAGTGTASVAGPVLLATSSRLGANPGDSLSLNGTLDGPGALDIVGGGTVTLRNPVGSAQPLASLISDATTTLVVNGGLIVTSGTQTYNGLTAIGGSTTLRTLAGGDIVANGPVTESVGTLSLDTGTGNSTFANTSNDFATVSVTSGNSVSLIDANALSLGTSNVRTLQAQTLSGNLTLTGAIAASGTGDAIVIAAAGNFINTGGSLLAGAGRWLVYSTDPALNTLGGLVPDFKRYNCTFTAGCLTPGTTLPSSGNGLVYGIAPTVNIAANGVATVYGTSAPALTYSANGFIDGDTAATALTGALARTTGGASGSGNETVGTYTINQGSLGSPLGYKLTFAAADYTIDPRTLAVSASAQSKVYDGTTTVAVTLTDDRISGDALNTSYASALFLDQNAGAGKSVNVAGIALSGADAGNYRLTSSSAIVTADIVPRPIVVSADSQTKLYGSPDPTLTFAVNAGGLLGSDTLFGALTRQPGETVTAGPYAITQGTLANSNYSITFNSGTLVITPVTLSYVADPVSIYQWTAMPQFTGTVTGFVAGDTLASATTGALTFSPGSPSSNIAGIFSSTGSGLQANSGDYVFVQAPGNATAFQVLASGETQAAGAPPQAYSGGLASTNRTEGSCAQTGGVPPRCDLLLSSARSNLPLAILGSGLNLPVDATAMLSY